MVTLGCNPCGSELCIPDDVRFVTCVSCSATLEVVDTSSVRYTRDWLPPAGARASVSEDSARAHAAGDRFQSSVTSSSSSDLVRHVRQLERELSVHRLDDAWRQARAKYLVRTHGGRSVPRKDAAAGAVIGSIIGAVVLCVVGAHAHGAITFAGIAFGVLGIGAASHSYHRAERYQSARRSYLERRNELIQGFTAPDSAERGNREKQYRD